jgi:hypothetical protein
VAFHDDVGGESRYLVGGHRRPPGCEGQPVGEYCYVVASLPRDQETYSLEPYLPVEDRKGYEWSGTPGRRPRHWLVVFTLHNGISWQ